MDYTGFLNCYLTVYRNVNATAANQVEKGLCAYSGGRDAQFKNSKYESSVKVKKGESLFTRADGSFCVTTPKYCGDRMVWQNGGADRCHDMVGQVWLEEDEGVSNEQPVSLLEVESTRHVKESGGIFDRNAEKVHQKSYERLQHDGVNTVVASELPTDRVARSINLPLVPVEVSASTGLLDSYVQVARRSEEYSDVVEPLMPRSQPSELVSTSTEQEDYPVPDLADQYLVSTGASAVGSIPTASTAVASKSLPVELTCPTACLMNGEEMCNMAKAACSVQSILAVPSAYLGCLSDVCLKEDKRFVQLAIIDATISAKLFTKSAVVPDANSDSGSSSGVSRLPTPLQCPEFSFGSELWNIDPYASTIPFWNTAQLKKICCVSSMQSSALKACESIRVGLCG